MAQGFDSRGLCRTVARGLALALLASTAASARTVAIEASGAGTAGVAPDRFFVQVDVGIKGGRENALESVTPADVERVRKALLANGIAPSQIASVTLQKPQAPYDSNEVIDQRPFGAILVEVRKPGAAGVNGVRTLIDALAKAPPLRPSLFVERGAESFELDDCRSTEAKAQASGIENARTSATRFARALTGREMTIDGVPADVRSTLQPIEVGGGHVLCGPSTPPVLPPQIYALAQSDDAEIRETTAATWLADVAVPAQTRRATFSSSEYFSAAGFGLELRPGRLRAAAGVYDDAVRDGSARRLEVAIAHTRAAWLASDLSLTLGPMIAIGDPVTEDPEQPPVVRFFTHEGTIATVDFTIANAAQTAPVIDAVGDGRVDLPATRARAEVSLQAPALDDFPAAVERLLARYGKNVTTGAQGRSVAVEFTHPTAETVSRLRSEFATIPNANPHMNRLRLSFSIDDCWPADERALALAAANARTNAVEAAASKGVALGAPIAAVDLGSPASGGDTSPHTCGPAALAHPPPGFLPDETSLTIETTARVSVRYATVVPLNHAIAPATDSAAAPVARRRVAEDGSRERRRPMRRVSCPRAADTSSGIRPWP